MISPLLSGYKWQRCDSNLGQSNCKISALLACIVICPVHGKGPSSYTASVTFRMPKCGLSKAHRLGGRIEYWKEDWPCFWRCEPNPGSIIYQLCDLRQILSLPQVSVATPLKCVELHGLPWALVRLKWNNSLNRNAQCKYKGYGHSLLSGIRSWY